jgi:NUMOD3 motif
MGVRKAMSENRKGINNNFFGKSHTLNVKDQLRNIALNRTKQPKPGALRRSGSKGYRNKYYSCIQFY